MKSLIVLIVGGLLFEGNSKITLFLPLDGELALASHWVAVSDTEKRPKHGFLRPKNA
jgi:hypothetical protein